MPVSLEILNLSGDASFSGTPHKFTGGIPAEWSSMTNLEQLGMQNCGLDGECLVLNHQCLHRVDERQLRNNSHGMFLARSSCSGTTETQLRELLPNCSMIGL